MEKNSHISSHIKRPLSHKKTSKDFQYEPCNMKVIKKDKEVVPRKHSQEHFKGYA